MAAITRTADTDDDGTGTTGTIRTNAWKTELYDQIDAAIAGLMSVTTFGTHSISAGGTGANELVVRNTTAGTGNYARVIVSQDEGTTGALSARSSTYTPSGFA